MFYIELILSNTELLIASNGSTKNSVFNPVIESKANDASKLRFTIPKTNYGFTDCKVGERLEVSFGFESFSKIFVGIVTETAEDYITGEKEVEALDLYGMMKRTAAPNKTYSGALASVVSSIVTDFNSRFSGFQTTVGTVDPGSIGSVSVQASDNTFGEVLDKLVKSYGGFFCVYGATLNFFSTGYEPTNSDGNFAASIGYNVLTMRKTVNSTESYEIKAVDNYWLDHAGRPWRIGDKITVRTPEEELSEHPAITKMTMSLDDPTQNTVTVGIDSVQPISKR